MRRGRTQAALVAAVTVLFVLPLWRPAAASPAAASPVAASPAAARTVPRKAVWIEVSANLRALASREGIRALVATARAAGVDTLVPEAKNAWGFAMYESGFVPHIRTSPVARAAYPAPAQWFPRDFDPLETLIDEAHAAGLRVHVAVNAFGEGLRLDPRQPVVGLIPTRPELESQHLRPGPDGAAVVPSSAVETIAFLNPGHPEAQLYELAVVWEVLSRYRVDGLVLDRARYAGLDADFSDLSRRRFEAVLGRPVARWPHDVLAPLEGGGYRPGPLFPAWTAWRASVITGYVRAASRIVRQVRPGLPVAMYVGAWYPQAAWELGQNWAHPDAPRLFPAWTPAFAQASLVPYLDYLMIGLYYRPITPLQALALGGRWWRSVAGGALLARQITGGLPVVATIWPAVFRGDREGIAAALRAGARYTDGLVVFDLSDLDAGGLWPLLASL